MRLTGFQVTNFRSVRDSGWIAVPRVAALIGVNESGKTNLLVPLWKLNPAREGQIQPTADYPKTLFGQIRAQPDAYRFITAAFDTEELADTLAEATGLPAEKIRHVDVGRYFDGRYSVSFPDAEPARTVPSETIAGILETAQREIGALIALQKEDGLKDALTAALGAARMKLPEGDLNPEALEVVIADVKRGFPEEPAKTSTIVPRFARVIDTIGECLEELKRPAPGDIDAVHQSIVAALPKFVYYSNYGNLDSEIYLPHVVQNLQRTDLGAKEADKARTLRVLFRFVQLSPEEILQLGRDFPRDPQGRQPTADEIEAIAEKKRVRSILLQSAGAQLTTRFREWWKQGDYRFRFEADGDHFRIWVSDDRRPEEVELESRSSGLQWFLSFYLVFLVESGEAHRDAVLLLDEPGLSLHPLAQRNLSDFFEGLAATNQILYTTHSPFLVDADHLDRARKVYVAEDGTTKATEDLRQGSDQAGAAYAVYSALNLSVAESILLGCQPIIVEGASDQHYLTGIKALLIGDGKLAPKRELVFPPSGGTRTARITASILTGRDENLPLMLLDDDGPGRQMATELKRGLYVDAPDRVLSVATFTGIAGSEIEDLFPLPFMAEVVDRWQRGPDEAFADIAIAGKPVVGQIEAWTEKHGVKLERGWKVDLAKRLKRQALDRGIQAFDEHCVGRWIELFRVFGQ